MFHAVTRASLPLLYFDIRPHSCLAALQEITVGPFCDLQEGSEGYLQTSQWWRPLHRLLLYLPTSSFSRTFWKKHEFLARLAFRFREMSRTWKRASIHLHSHSAPPPSEARTPTPRWTPLHHCCYLGFQPCSFRSSPSFGSNVLTPLALKRPHDAALLASIKYAEKSKQRGHARQRCGMKSKPAGPPAA